MKTVNLCRPVIAANTALSQMPWNDFDRVIESFFRDDFSSPSERILNPMKASYFPRIDVRENDKAYVLEAELPGFDEKEIEINLENNILCLSSKKTETSEAEEKKDDYIIRERRFSSFSRSFKLPANADPETVKAVFKNGILSLEIAKKAEAAKKLIPISHE